jgi:lipoprotein-anchoring transpeptidase ErfK/SrfK
MAPRHHTRRIFLKMALLSLGGLAMRPWMRQLGAVDGVASQDLSSLPSFPQADRLGRVLAGKVALKARPDEDSADVSELFEDSVVVWLREVVGNRPLWDNQRFVETPDGYIYAPNLQPVQNRPNQALDSLPDPLGMWVEVTVPYVDLVLANPPPRSPWLEHAAFPRLYYSQIMWVDQIRRDEGGQVWYRVLERYGSFGDIFWAPAEAFRPMAAGEVSPIQAEASDKQVVVDLTYQMLSCYERSSEVYFCRVSTGPLIAQGGSKKTWATPLGNHTIWRKLVSVHMTGGTTGGGYDLPGIGWTTLFSSKGMAIHSTFWHNSFGVPRSHGCVNASPADAQWVFRWTSPAIPFETGDITVTGQESTRVLVKES